MTQATQFILELRIVPVITLEGLIRHVQKPTCFMDDQEDPVTTTTASATTDPHRAYIDAAITTKAATNFPWIIV